MKYEIKEALRLDCRLVVYNEETVDEIAKAVRTLNKKARVHIKIETGTNRQGVLPENAVKFARYIRSKRGIEIEGIATHFANLEDRINTEYADFQIRNFNTALAELKRAVIKIPIKHCANSASTILMSHTHMDLVRPGIAVYGLWPSEKTKISADKLKKKIVLHPVLSWRTRIAQIKTVEKGGYIGYGCTFKTQRKTRLALLPVGYYDGYDRSGLSNTGHVLIHGRPAPICGRVHMNTMMADITDIPGVHLENTATLIGIDGRAEVTADHLAELCGTINYEITTRINERIPRIVV